MSDDQSAERYRHVRTLGHGAMGEVWLAEDTLLDRMVAIKQMLPTAADIDHRAADRIRREARTVARLHHPNIVGVFDLIVVGGRDCLVMEYVEGTTLADVLARRGRLPVGEVVGIFLQIARALDIAHRAGVIHRDVKPTNIIVTDRGVAKLADFGIARGEGDDSLTATGYAVGTVAYMAPEIGLGDDASAASDGWALGAAMYAALEGHAPHDDPGRAGTGPLLRRRITEEPTPPVHAGTLTGLLGELLAADPAVRPDAAATANRLARAQTDATGLVALTGSWQPGSAWAGPAAAQLPPTDIVATSPAPAPAQPVQARRPSPGSAPARGAVPAEVVLAALGLLATGVLVLVPVFDLIGPMFRAVFSGDDIERDLGLSLAHVLVLHAAASVALALLAVGLLRGRRAPVVLTAVSCALVAAWQVVALVVSGDRRFTLPVASWAAVTALGLCVAVVVLLAARPQVRGWFAADTRRVGLATAALVSGYGGAVAVLAGVLLALIGRLDRDFVWTGLGTGAAGVVLLAVAAPLGAGRRGAGATAILADLGLAAAVIAAAVQFDTWTAYGALVPLGVLATSLAGLVASIAGREPGPAAAPVRYLPGALAAACVAAALVATSAAVGLTHREPDHSAAPYEDDSSTVLDDSSARAAAGYAFSAMQKDSTYATCTGNDDQFAIDSYEIGDVTADTDGTFLVSAQVGLPTGGSEAVSVRIGSDSNGGGCVESGSMSVSAPADPGASGTTASPSTPPSDVPAVPSGTDSVPTDAALPSAPTNAAYPYDGQSVPTTEDEIVEYAPERSALDGDQYAAVQTVIAFMTYINKQDLGSAYGRTVAGAGGATADAGWRNGWLTSRFYQVEFGEPLAVGGGFMIVPSRWVSRQNPNEQHARLDGSTCDYWPQYMFLMRKIGGSWYFTNTNKYDSDAFLGDYVRSSTSGGLRLNPVQQRESC